MIVSDVVLGDVVAGTRPSRCVMWKLIIIKENSYKANNIKRSHNLRRNKIQCIKWTLQSAKLLHTSDKFFAERLVRSICSQDYRSWIKRRCSVFALGWAWENTICKDRTQPKHVERKTIYLAWYSIRARAEHRRGRKMDNNKLTQFNYCRTWEIR